ncbi:MAG: Sau3AI family type II restriction endonuclease [Patescibacteria group bacterium]
MTDSASDTMPETIYRTEEEVVTAANRALHKTLKEFIPREELDEIEDKLAGYGTNRKGYLGDLIERYVFGIANNGRAEADFKLAGIELKSTPLRRHKTKRYVAKERLVFSMIDYDKVISERWETSSFLEKNRLLLIMFYLYLDKGQSVLDYEFEFVHLLDLLEDISEQDAEQIRKDWQFIIDKIRRGDAHLLSEGDTFYLGACTKARNSRVVRDQPMSRTPAKPRAFSLKQAYLNHLIQRNLLGARPDAESIYRGEKHDMTIDEVVEDKFGPYIGKSDTEIMQILGWRTDSRPKNFKRLLANRILTGTGSNKIEEFEKADVTLRVVTLETDGSLRESISFPAFDYKNLITQLWYDQKEEIMSDFHAELEMSRFLFVVFQKTAEGAVRLSKVKFWNFPAEDFPEAERVFDLALRCIEEGRYRDLPKITGSPVAHVRPHAKDSSDTQETPQGTQEIKRSFWLNAKYIESVLKA